MSDCRWPYTRRPVSTPNRQAPLFMNQGLNLAYAFNHAEGAAYLMAMPSTRKDDVPTLATA